METSGLLVEQPFWDERDRYSQSDCEKHPLAARLAACLETEQYHHVPAFAAVWAREVAMELFKTIPAQVVWEEKEPYTNLHAMMEDCGKGILRVRFRRWGPIWAQCMKEFRAVHDWFGHFQTASPFSLSGEIAAASRHFAQFPQACWPAIWSHAVLENAYRLNRGKWLCYPRSPRCPAKVVFDRNQFGDETEWYARARR